MVGAEEEEKKSIFRQVRTPALYLVETTPSILRVMRKMVSSNVPVGIKRGGCES
mgnify:CR=1 FL=1